MNIKKFIRYVCLFASIAYTKTYSNEVKVQLVDIERQHNRRLIVQKPRDIAFLIADIKYDGNTLKILEFGLGPQSHYKGHEQLYGPGKILEHARRYLSQFRLPLFFVNSQHPEHLIQNRLFQHVRKTYCATNKNYAGMIIVNGYNTLPAVSQKLHAQYPECLILNRATVSFARNKYATSTIFRELNLQDYKPLWQSYNVNTPNLHEQILQDFQTAEYLVIKPFNASQGYGINIIPKAHLKDLLQEILPTKLIAADDYWTTHTPTHFLVEEFVTSKTITVNKEKFDGTMRVVFAIDYVADTVTLTMLGKYWKLPPKSLDEQGTLNELHKSNISKSRPICSAKVNKKDYYHIKKLLKKIIPPIYLKMLEKTEELSK